MELAEIVMNPARQRIFQFFLLHETGTVKELKKALPDIPSASLYRHIKILADCSILMVVDENRIRGTVESVYQLNKDAMATEDETGNVVQMSLLSICASFAKYFSTGNADPQKDYDAVHKLYAAADGRGIFGVSFGNQSGYGQVHEAGKLRKQQTAENHAAFPPRRTSR